MTQSIPVPPGVPTVRFQEPRRVVLPDGPTPLIHPDDPARAKIQERWVAGSRQFNLGVPEDARAHEALWQQVCDGTVTLVPEASRTEFQQRTGNYVLFLRWYTVDLLPPPSPSSFKP